uniref:Substrate-binding domain-containing protein n=1 Tax=Roseihalotalea indica TaxID=2867963 RepID=A0AA49GTV9_9BACT|nr:substrate-binding domain-containing protein [Tunicatimonas sp. TK19036]
MKYGLIFFSVVLFLVSCDPKKGAKYREQQAAAAAVEVNPNEEYVMVTTAVNMPLYMNHDQAAFKRWGQQRGVKTSILGPSEWDIQSQIATIEQVIGTKPTGLLINGTDPAIASSINKAVEAGIPTVVYDSDIPQSKRHAFLGTDWYQMGRLQGEEMVKLIGGKGKVVCMGILGMTNMEAGFQGLQDVLKEYPDIEYIGKYDDKANVEEAARITSDLLSAYPDLAGICGFDVNSGPGIGLAIKEANKVGKVKVTTVDWEPEHLKLVQEGVIDLLVGQKRELFTWYGAQFLYDMVHQTNRLSGDDNAAGITNVPYQVNTGLLIITPENIDQFTNL